MEIVPSTTITKLTADTDITIECWIDGRLDGFQRTSYAGAALIASSRQRRSRGLDDRMTLPGVTHRPVRSMAGEIPLPPLPAARRMRGVRLATAAWPEIQAAGRFVEGHPTVSLKRTLSSRTSLAMSTGCLKSSAPKVSSQRNFKCNVVV
jgi:hypothetical protein